jgi:hypothetical protein
LRGQSKREPKWMQPVRFEQLREALDTPVILTFVECLALVAYGLGGWIGLAAVPAFVVFAGIVIGALSVFVWLITQLSR